MINRSVYAEKSDAHGEKTTSAALAHESEPDTEEDHIQATANAAASQQAAKNEAANIAEVEA